MALFCQQCAQHPDCGHGGVPGVNTNGIWFPNCWLPPKKGSHICVKEGSKLILWIKKLTQKAFHQSDFSFTKKKMYFSEVLFCISAFPKFKKQKGEKCPCLTARWNEYLSANAGRNIVFNCSEVTVQTLHVKCWPSMCHSLLRLSLLLVINVSMPWSWETEVHLDTTRWSTNHSPGAKPTFQIVLQ